MTSTAMPSESVDHSNSNRRGMVVQRSFGYPPPPESDPLQCPRCESTNTKFCYYNNYNLRQPRHFCKACRRYWTHGGTLRPVPVGGGTRKRTTKRPRCSSGGSSSSCSPSSSSLTQEVSSAGPVVPGNPMSASAGENSDAAASAAANNYLMDLNESMNSANGGFSSLLSFQGPPGFLALGGFGSGLPHGFDEMGNFGYGGRGGWAFPQGGGEYGSVQNNNNNVGLPGAQTGCNNTWQMMNGSEDGLVDFGWPEHEISTAAPATVREVTELSDQNEGLISHFQEMI